MNLQNHIQEFPDFPKTGILFRDISPLMRSPELWIETIDQMEKSAQEQNPDLIIGIDARGFIIGSALAIAMKKGFIPIRKKGKLPGEVIGINYELEYGTDTLEIQVDSLKGVDKVYIVDDLLATGGTAKAAADLINITDTKIAGFGFVVELTSLNGRKELPTNIPINSLIKY